MKISTRGRYALRMMIDIAEHQADGYVALRDVAARQDISKKYLEQISLPLSQAGMLKATRGHQGGYQLARPIESYTVYSILQAVEDSMSTVSCLASVPNRCPRRETCRTLPLWIGLDRVVFDYLNGITLADLLARDLPADGQSLHLTKESDE